MAEIKRYRSLTFKLMAAMCLAFLCALITFAASCLMGTLIVDRFLISEEAVRQRLDQEIGSFRTYVTDNQVSSTDVVAIGAWNQNHQHIQLTVYGLTTTVSSTSSGAELMGNELGLVIRAGEMAEGAVEYPVNFSDGVYAVSIYDTSTWIYFGIMILIALALAVGVFLSAILLYDQHITRTVMTLSRQVRQVSRGDLQMPIQPMSHDEIGQLALDVDTMRLSIIDKLRREEEAWKANTQLITAISHDVRTPLTALMGYLEILSDGSVPEEERQTYLQVCKNNASRLKGLTDELFGFFLVFGKPTVDQNPEEFDAAMLMSQILSEHQMNLLQRDFQVEVAYPEEMAGKLRVDLTHLRRVFDNLFSNVSKYADPARPVDVRLCSENGDMIVSITNYIGSHSGRVESNGIGLQTCNKLVAAMGGEFNKSRTKDTFTAEVVLPLVVPETPET